MIGTGEDLAHPRVPAPAAAQPQGACAICAVHQDQPSRSLFAWESDDWLLRHHPAPAPLVGWMMLDSRRHVGGPADFSHSERQGFGTVLQMVSDAIRRGTGCDRVYCVAFGESARHFHMHLIPRHQADAETAAWSVAEFYLKVVDGTIKPASTADVLRVTEAIRNHLAGLRV